MHFQLGREFAGYANKQHCLSLPRIALYPQEPLRITVVPVSEVLVVLVIKNPLVRVGKQVIFPLLKGLNLCSHIRDTQLLHDLVLRLGNMHVDKESKV